MAHSTLDEVHYVMSRKEVAEAIGVSVSDVRRTELNALRKLSIKFPEFKQYLRGSPDHYPGFLKTMVDY